MKTTNAFLLFAALAAVAAFQTGCSKSAPTSTSGAMPATASTSTATASTFGVSTSGAPPAMKSTAIASTAPATSSDASTAIAPPATMSASSAGGADTAPVTLAMIKDYSYEKRDQFVAGIVQLAAIMDEDRYADDAKTIRYSPSAAQEHNDAVRDYVAARHDLRDRLTTLSNASSDTWADAKEHVDRSWQDVTDAYARMKATVTP